jgi:hypothetical protein
MQMAFSSMPRDRIAEGVAIVASRLAPVGATPAADG